jgi:SAM-dependent methyltransferase
MPSSTVQQPPTLPAQDKNAQLVAKQKAHFDKIASVYHQARQHPNYLLLKDLIWGEFFRHFSPTFPQGKRLRVLEAMCGFSDGQAILARHLQSPFDYTGFDYSSTVVDIMHKERPELHIYQQDITQFESRESYDIIILLGGLHHVPHAAGKAVEKLCTALAPGGYFINAEPTNANVLIKLVRDGIYRRHDFFDDETEQAFSVRQLFSFFKHAGLKQSCALFPGLLAYIFYFNPDAFPYLNIGGSRMVRGLWAIDRLFARNIIGRYLSFATLSSWQKPL